MSHCCVLGLISTFHLFFTPKKRINKGSFLNVIRAQIWHRAVVESRHSKLGEVSPPLYPSSKLQPMPLLQLRYKFFRQSFSSKLKVTVVPYFTL